MLFFCSLFAHLLGSWWCTMTPSNVQIHHTNIYPMLKYIQAYIAYNYFTLINPTFLYFLAETVHIDCEINVIPHWFSYYKGIFQLMLMHTYTGIPATSLYFIALYCWVRVYHIIFPVPASSPKAPLVDSNPRHSSSAMLMLLSVVFLGLAVFLIYKFKRYTSLS